jgi:uncharacterized protein (TIGR02145 family)
MAAIEKRTGYVLLIFSAIFLPLCILAIFFSCERFDYERVIIIETGSVTEETSSSAKITGQLIDLGESEIVEHGHIWAEKNDNKALTVELKTKTTLGPKTTRGFITSELTDLSPETVYKVIAYATSSQGTVYGKEATFKTLSSPGVAPVAEFTAYPTFAEAGELVEFTDLSTNNPTSWYWEFGDESTSTEQNPKHRYLTLDNFTVSLTATNSYGSDNVTKNDYIIVYAIISKPVADFDAKPTILSAGESVQFTDHSTNTPTEWYWDFGDGGYSSSQNPQYVYDAAGIYTVSLTVANVSGSDTLIREDYITVNESVILEGAFTDERDNHVYKWVQIGEQVWMAENLAFLPEVNPPDDYSSTDPVNYVYGYTLYDTADAKALLHYKTYGVLYNWSSAILYCPVDWHLPDDADWQELIYYLGGASIAGGKLKEAGFEHWDEPNSGADNTSGFTALPGGTYFNNTVDHFSGEGRVAYWWSSEVVATDTVYIQGVNYDEAYIRRVTDATHNGNSIRCVMDNGALKKKIPAVKNDMILEKKEEN